MLLWRFFILLMEFSIIEQGQTNITVSTLAEICEYFDISLLDFLEKN